MNLKEAMHGDEKQELDAEVHESDSLFSGGDAAPTTNGGGQTFLSEQDPMNMSFYNDENNENNPFNTKESQEVDMNAVQPLPDFIEDENQENEIVDFVAQPIELNNQNKYSEMDELIKEFSSEGEKLNLNQHDEAAEQFGQPTPITNFVHELATEVTSILNEVEQQSNVAYDNNQDFMQTEHHVSQSEIIEASPGNV